MAHVGVQWLHATGVRIQRQDTALEAPLLLVVVHALGGANLQVHLAATIGSAIRLGSGGCVFHVAKRDVGRFQIVDHLDSVVLGGVRELAEVLPTLRHALHDGLLRTRLDQRDLHPLVFRLIVLRVVSFLDVALAVDLACVGHVRV